MKFHQLASILVLSLSAALAMGQYTQTFDTAPSDWTEVNSRAGTNPANAYGFSNTNNIGTGAGEAGGQIVRSATLAYYGMELSAPITSLDEPFSFSFDYKMSSAISGANVHLGLFNPTNLGATNDVDTAGNVIIANMDDGAKLYGLASAGDDNNRVNAPTTEVFIDQAVHNVSVTYDPDAGSFGEAAFLLDSTPHLTIALSEAVRNASWNLTHFGIFSSISGDTSSQLEFYVDNVTLDTGGIVPTPTPGPTLVTRTRNFDADPLWEGVNNTTSTLEGNDFGFSPETKNADGVTTGEIGGVYQRGPSPAWYADNNLGSLDPSDTALTISGQIMEVRDNGPACFGYFSATEPVEWAAGFGFAPAAICLYIDFYRVSATVILRGVNGDNSDRPIIQQVGTLTPNTPSSFTFAYDPAGNGGTGTMTYTQDGGTPAVINLSAGLKDLLPNFNHMGLFNAALTGGNTMTTWLDDLSYTVLESPAVNAARNWTTIE